MPVATTSIRHTCARCLRVRPRLDRVQVPRQARFFAASPPAQVEAARDNDAELGTSGSSGGMDGEEEGAMSRRLAQMSEESLEAGGRGARRAVGEAGFDEDLRRRLADRIAGASFKSQHASALAQAELPASAGQGTRDVAGARPWTGTETVEDAALRMLTDAHKPLRTSPKIPAPRGPPARVDTGRSKTQPSSGARLANARDRSSIYSTLKDSSMSEEDKAKFREELKARFQPGGRAAPATLQGLASLANERIEDAIARGQFKNLPRGKRIERDYNASSPFLDTTEYFMNKIIQKQDIVPPWIEKQQELVSTATKFRARLRNDWRRHAARLIASRGGSLQEQVRRAELYAAAEAVENPPKRKQETINTVDDAGHMSQITLSGELKATATAPSATPEPAQITITETPVSADAGAPSASSGQEPTTTIKITQPPADSTSQPTPAAAAAATAAAPAAPAPATLPPPFRDPAWESSERSYHELTIAHLNSLTRSYNLMAPAIAQKPYHSLARELRACYADVAPQLAAAIRERAAAPRARVEVVGHRAGGVMERFGAGEKVRVVDERRGRQYGFRELWRDLFGRER